MKRGPKKFLSTKEKIKKEKKKTEKETISTTAKTTAGGDQTSCISTIWMHAPARPSFGSAKKNSERASKRALPKP
jgi:hypothetical protein